MNTKNRFLSVLTAIGAMVACFSCTEGITPFLNRLNSDPVEEKPLVRSFIQPNTILISWQDDFAVDDYVLERKVDQNLALFSEIYRGKDLSYVDTRTEEGVQYLYRLTKTRGTEVFQPTQEYWALGVNENMEPDWFEPNDGPGAATTMDVPRVSSSFFYKATNGDIVQDTDWYVFTVPAHMTAHIVLVEIRVIEDLLPANTRFMYQIDGSGLPPSGVPHNTPFYLINYENEPQTFFFRIIPSEIYVLNGSSSGGLPLGYQIRVDRIEYNDI